METPESQRCQNSEIPAGGSCKQQAKMTKRAAMWIAASKAGGPLEILPQHSVPQILDMRLLYLLKPVSC